MVEEGKLVNFTFFENTFLNLPDYTRRIQLCLRQPLKTKEACLDQTFKSVPWDNRATKWQRSKGRSVVEDKYMHLFEEAEMPKKIPSIPEPAVGGPGDHSRMRWHVVAGQLETYNMLSMAWTIGEYSKG